jgi:hypothetical protein
VVSQSEGKLAFTWRTENHVGEHILKGAILKHSLGSRYDKKKISVWNKMEKLEPLCFAARNVK